MPRADIRELRGSARICGKISGDGLGIFSFTPSIRVKLNGLRVLWLWEPQFWRVRFRRRRFSVECSYLGFVVCMNRCFLIVACYILHPSLLISAETDGHQSDQPQDAAVCRVVWRQYASHYGILFPCYPIFDVSSHGQSIAFDPASMLYVNNRLWK